MAAPLSMTNSLNSILLKLRTSHNDSKDVVRSLIPLLQAYNARFIELEEKVDRYGRTIELLQSQLQDKINQPAPVVDLSKKDVLVLSSIVSDNSKKLDCSAPQGAIPVVQVESAVEAIAKLPPAEPVVAEQPPADFSPVASSLPAEGSPLIPPLPNEERFSPASSLAQSAKDIDKLRHIFKYEVNPDVGISYEELKSRFPLLKPTRLSNLCQRVRSDGLAHCVGRRNNSMWYPGPEKATA